LFCCFLFEKFANVTQHHENDDFFQQIAKKEQFDLCKRHSIENNSKESKYF